MTDSIVSSSAPKTEDPSRSRTSVFDRSDQAFGGLGVGGFGRDADLDLAARGEKGHGGVGGTRVEVVEAVGDPRLGTPPGSEQPAADHPVGTGGGMEPGQNVIGQEQLHLLGDAGKGEDPGAVVIDGQAGCGALRIGKHLGATGKIGLTEVGRRHLPSQHRPALPQPFLVLGRVVHRDSEGGADGLSGEIVLGGADPAGDDDRVGTFDGGLEGGCHASEVVAHHLLVVGVEPVLGEGAAEGGGVAVDDLAEEQFGADGHHFDDHGARSDMTVASRSLPKAAVISVSSHSPGRPASRVIIPSISGAWRNDRPTGVPSSIWSIRTMVRRPIWRRLRRSVISSWQAWRNRSRSPTSSAGTRSGRSAAGVPASGEYGKKPAQSSSTSSRKAGQVLDVVVGLAGEPDDEAGAEGGVGGSEADVVDQAAVGIAASGPLHRPEQAGTGVLKGEIEVRGHLGVVGHLGNESRTYLARIQIEQPEAAQSRELAEGAQQQDEIGIRPGGRTQVASVGGQILGDEDDLAHTGVNQSLHLGTDLDRAPGALLAPDQRDGTEGAGLVASFGHLDVGVGQGWGGPIDGMEDVHHGTTPDGDRLGTR
jgi:hypothetical protein